jgi:hypothetical protein
MVARVLLLVTALLATAPAQALYDPPADAAGTATLRNEYTCKRT